MGLSGRGDEGERADCLGGVGFEFEDHDFMTREALGELVAEEEFKELEWLLRDGA